MEKEKENEIEEFIEEHDVNDILKCIDTYDIIDYVDEEDLYSFIDNDVLVNTALEKRGLDILDCFEEDELLCYMNSKGYGNDNLLGTLESICRKLQPRGYIDKNEAKKLICDYIDTWMDRSFKMEG